MRQQNFNLKLIFVQVPLPLNAFGCQENGIFSNFNSGGKKNRKTSKKMSIVWESEIERMWWKGEEKSVKMMERKLMNIHCNGHTSTQHELSKQIIGKKLKKLCFLWQQVDLINQQQAAAVRFNVQRILLAHRGRVREMERD
jgi:hypothetical protein